MLKIIAIMSLAFVAGVFLKAQGASAASVQPTSSSTSNWTTTTIQLNWTKGAGGDEMFFAVASSTDNATFQFATTTIPSTTLSYTFTGLATNTRYYFLVAAVSSTNQATSTAATSTETYTLADIPSAPTVGTSTTSSLSFTINAATNPPSTTYILYISSSTWEANVATSGAFGGADVWQTTSTWGAIAVTGLAPNTSYRLRSIARNGANTTTVTSAYSTAKYTLANPAGTPTIGTPTATTLPITLALNGNPTTTAFAIYNTSTGNYLDSAYTATTTPVWQIVAEWGVGFQAVGLTPNTAYQFVVIARNGDNTLAATSSASAATYTLPSTPSSLSIAAAANSLAFSWTGDSTAYYAENITAGTNSGWISGTTMATGNINCGTSHTFRVKGRNVDLVETGWSSNFSGSTNACGSAMAVNITPTVPAVPAIPAVPGVSPAVPATPASVSLPSSASPRAVYVRTLRVGSRGNDVKQLQQQLRELGYFKYPTNTGYFGPATRAAVVAFQKSEGLRPYPGWVGPGTRAALNSL